MDNKLQQLTDKLYAEGVARGQTKAAELIAEAETKSRQIIDEARTAAEALMAKARQSAAELTRNTDSEIKLSAQQTVAALKQQILDMVSAKAVQGSIAQSLADPALLCEMVKLAIAGLGSADSHDVTLLIPESKKGALDSALQNSLHEALKNGLTIQTTLAIKGGFQIGPRDGRYKISFTDEDFSEFFKAYVRPRARTLLFGV